MAKVPNFILSNGAKFPALGLGTYKIIANAETAVRTAIDLGYTHIDTAKAYDNEECIGKALNGDGIDRSKIFVTTKLDSSDARPGDVVAALKTSLSKLNLSHVDLYLMHTPWTTPRNTSTVGDGSTESAKVEDIDLLDTWNDMEECVELGLATSIGVSNFSEEQVELLVKNCKKHPPAVNQVECHPWFNQASLIEHHAKLNVHVSAFSAIGRGNRVVNSARPNLELLQDPLILELSKKYSTTPANICTRFQIQRGVSIILKAASTSNQKTNIRSFDSAIVIETSDMDRLLRLPQERGLTFEARSSLPNFPW